MKNFRTLLIYCALAALLGGYIYFFERGPVKKKDEEKKVKVFDNFVADDITRIHLENLGTTLTAEKSPIDIEKDEKGIWQITAPKQLKADETMVRSLLSGVGDFTPDSTIEDPANLADYGLKNPGSISVFKTKAGASFEVRVGDKNAAGSSCYVLASGKKTLFLLPATSLDGLKKKVDEFRDHSFIKTDMVLAKKIRVTRDGKVFEFEKNKDNAWNITEPIVEKADENKVRDLLNNLNGLRIDSFVKDHSDGLETYGLSKPHAKIEVWNSDGGPSKTILFGHDKEKTSNCYAKTTDLPAVYLVANYIEKATNLKLSDVRDKSVMKFDAGSVNGITVRRGAKTWVYQKGDKGLWTSEGRTGANDEGVNIISQLSQTTIVDFASKDAVTGLINPSFIVELSMADKTTRRFRFGNRDQNMVYLASDKAKDVYKVSSAVISQLEVYFSAILTPVPATTPLQMPKK